MAGTSPRLAGSGRPIVNLKSHATPARRARDCPGHSRRAEAANFESFLQRAACGRMLRIRLGIAGTIPAMTTKDGTQANCVSVCAAFRFPGQPCLGGGRSGKIVGQTDLPLRGRSPLVGRPPFEDDLPRLQPQFCSFPPSPPTSPNTRRTAAIISSDRSGRDFEAARAIATAPIIAAAIVNARARSSALSVVGFSAV
jgi:hypothetical protein